uniref:Headcase middle domain-containing protein n=1 Tax=Plectus sambesii TaxID=2011161 RepID=A0A914XDP3_9BILA
MEPPGGGRQKEDESETTREDCRCCCPRGCVVGELIDVEDPEDAVPLQCSNNDCTVSHWMHRVCFEGFEHHVLAALRQSSRTRGWTDKQRIQNLWTKRGYDICYRACACLCGHGYLKKDTTYVPPKADDEGNLARRQQRRQRRHQNSKQLPVIGQGRTVSHNEYSAGPQLSPPGSYALAARGRSRTLSVGSVAGLKSKLDTMKIGANAEDGSHTPPQRPNPHPRKGSSLSTGDANGFFGDTQVQSTGSIFKRRTDMSAFLNVLPRWKVNGFFIKLEDDCPQGNDDTRIFLLTNLGGKSSRQVTCLLCNDHMAVYDRYPLLDGTFFLSPVNHDQLGTKVRFEGREAYLHALCMKCLENCSRRLACNRCGSVDWFPGGQLTLGGLYTYDVLSTTPCCPPECRECRSPMLMCDPMRPGLQQGHFSVFSEASVCSACGAKGPHYVRRMDTFHLLSQQQHQPERADSFELGEQAKSRELQTALGAGLLEAMDLDDVARNFSFANAASTLVAAQN